jgi:hypothetical protein
VINLHGRGPLLLQTVWQIEGDRHGRRRTDIDKPTDLRLLMARLAELLPLIWSAPGGCANLGQGRGVGHRPGLCACR